VLKKLEHMSLQVQTCLDPK